MKTRHLPILLLTFVLILYATPTIHTAGLPDPPNHTDTIKPPPSDLDDEPIEPWDGPVGVPGDSSISPGTPSFAIWHVETVDEEWGLDPSLALDEAWHPHISYSSDGLKYAWHDGVNWHVETVDSEELVGRATSLALDEAGYPHISYSDHGNDNLKYARYNGENWHVETVDSEVDVVRRTSLALDGMGYPHISYFDYDSGDLKYAWHNGTDWRIEIVDSVDNWGEYTSLALDEAGHPHISYYASHPNRDLKYAWHNGMNWQIETVDSVGDVGQDTSLALDEAGQPHVSYFDSTNDDLKYAWHNGTNWQIETVDSEGEVGGDTSLALDEEGHPHISYSDYDNDNLKYAWYNGANWQIETVDSEGDMGLFSSLALDGAGHPHISYCNYTNYDLKYAWRRPFSLDKQVAPSDSLNDIDALTHTLTYSLTLFGPDWNFFLHDPLPDAVRYVSGSIASTLTPPAIYSPTLNAVVWEGTLPTNTAQTVHFQVTLAVTSTRFLSAPLSIVNTARLTATEDRWGIAATAAIDVIPPPFALDKKASFDGTYLYNGDLLTYTLDLAGPGLNFRLWDPLPDTVRYVPGSLISTLTPPAAYSPTARAIIWEGTLLTDTTEAVRFRVTANVDDFSDQAPSLLPLVNVAWLTATESDRSVSAIVRADVTIPPSTDNWHIETVDSEGVLGYNTSLALDEAGQPHISYRDGFPNYGLKYAWHNGTNWQIETLDSAGIWGRDISLALDEEGHPHISHFDDSSNLKYAWHNGTSWQIETVDSEEGVGYDQGCSVLPTPDAGTVRLKAQAPSGGYHKPAKRGSAISTAVQRRAMAVGTIRPEQIWWHYDTSLALDEAGHPHISYHDGPSPYYNYDFRYAWHNGTNWQIETVISEGYMGNYTSLALDEAGHPHISYHDGSPNLKYAWHNGTNWQIETVDRERYVSWGNSLALDEAGRPHISYYSGGLYDYSLKYAWHNGTDWQIETLDNERYVGRDNLLALDEAGRPHISYSDGSPNHDLKYARYDSAKWQIKTLDSEEIVGLDTSLALDEAGHPYISYYGATNGDLKYTWHNGTNWQIEIVDSEGDVGSYSSLALDEAGRPHIGYFDNNNRDLKYARWLPFSLNKQVALSDSLNDIDALTHTLTYSLTLFGPGLSVRFQDPLPDTVHYVSGSIASTLTPPAVYSPTHNAVVWEGTLPTDTAQTIRFQVTLQITSTRFLSAPLSIVNAAWMDDLEHERRVLDTAAATITPPPLTLKKQATPRDGLRNNDTLTYTLTISGPDLNVRLWDPLPPLVRYVNGSITGTVTPTAIYSPTVHAVVWQGTLPTDTVQTVQFQVTLGITGTGSLDLARPIVNTAWLTDTESGWSVSATVIVNGWRAYLPFVLR